MLVVMQAQATEDQVRAVCQKIEALGYRPHSMPGAQRTAIGITGNKGEVEAGSLEEMPGVQEVIRVSKPYKLVSRDTKPDNTVIKFPNSQVTIGGRDLAIIAGPCGIETRDQAFKTAERVARAGAQFFRGGAYKPRTSPYSFQGLGEEGLKIMAEIREQFGLLVVTEAVDYESLDLVDQLVGFGEKKIGVQREDADIRAHACRDVDERNVLRAEARRNGGVRMKLRQAPAHDFFRAPALRAGLHGVDFLLCSYAH